MRVALRNFYFLAFLHCRYLEFCLVFVSAYEIKPRTFYYIISFTFFFFFLLDSKGIIKDYFHCLTQGVINVKLFLYLTHTCIKLK